MPIHNPDDDEEDRAAVYCFVQIAVPLLSCRIPVDELISRKDAIQCTKIYSDDIRLDNIVSEDTEESSEENDDNHGEVDIGTIEEQLPAFTQVKSICDAQGVDKKAFMKVTWDVQSTVRAEKLRSLGQITIDQFLGN